MDAEMALVDELHKLTLANDVKGIETSLEKLSTAGNLQSVELKGAFLELFNLNSAPVNLLAAKTIAELTKSPEQRAKFSNNEIIEKLLELLSTSMTKNKTSENVEFVIQLCRAFGNIFYSNDDSRNIVFHLDGGKTLVDLFRTAHSEIRDQLDTFVKVRSGVMSNYLLGNEELSQKAIELGVIDHIMSRMQETSEGREHLLTIFSILTEQVSDLIFKPEILSLIVTTLKETKSSEVAESCLELLLCQAESDDVKLLIARDGLCEHIFHSHEKFKNFEGDLETKSLLKLTCDLIVLVLTGDEAMHHLDKTSLLADMNSWLESPDVDLMTTSVLALGNFARTDEHCTRMVRDKMHLKLVEILGKNNGSEADVRLQHALLSTIRNLVIPKQNKVAVIEAGLVDIILPMLEIYQPPVVFKLLGTLRMLVDGQEELALKLLGDDKLVAILIDWARKTPDMVGVNSESSRLMAWLIKNGYRSRGSQIQSVDPLKTFIAVDGSVDVLVKMLDSAHLVMQNEALLALTLSVVLLRSSEAELNKIFIASSLGSTLAEFIQRTSEMDRTSNEIVENLNALVTALRKSDEMKLHLSQHNIDEKLKIVPRIRELATL